MIPLSLWLLAIGTADAVASLSGQPPSSGMRAWLGIVVGSTVSCFLAVLAGGPSGAVAIVTCLSVISCVAWILPRRATDTTPRRALIVLWSAFSATLVMLLVAGAWPDFSGGLLERWLTSSPFPTIRSLAVERMLLSIGIVSVLQATGNGLVRLVLAAVATPTEKLEKKLKGGRIIGPMERTLMFGFTLWGQPLAAALVVSAKGLLRFPEIQRSSETRPNSRGDFTPRPVDEITEYVLVGSLASWILALAPVILIRA